MAVETMLVRVKPYNKKKNHILRRYTYRGIRFRADRGWYRVANDVASYLKSVRQIPEDEDSPDAFDVCTEKEAKAVDKREAHQARGALPADEALDVTKSGGEHDGFDEAFKERTGDLTTADLPSQTAAGASKGGKGKGKRKAADSRVAPPSTEAKEVSEARAAWSGTDGASEAHTGASGSEGDR